jgi:hypothetical protein
MGALGGFLGATIAMATDPPLVVAALLVGFASKNWRVFLIAAAATAPLVHLGITYMVMDWQRQIGLQETYAEEALMSAPYRLTAFAVIACVAFGLRRFAMRMRGSAGR